MKVIVAALCLLLHGAVAFQPLAGVTLPSVPDGTSVNLGDFRASTGKTMIVFGTYAADFNAIEYAQRFRYYWPRLRDEKNIQQCAFIFNAEPDAITKLRNYLEMPTESSITYLSDTTGRAGRVFGVERGWLPENEDINPFLKLFGMLFGLGAWATLPAVIGGYIGNPWVPQPWITDALVVGNKQGRWPNNAVELADGDKIVNKFEELPLVGGWQRRPLELATLRLQSMLGVSLSHWKELSPSQEALDAGVLTQLGGCVVLDESGSVLYEWKDPGICAVANFEDMLKKI